MRVSTMPIKLFLIVFIGFVGFLLPFNSVLSAEQISIQDLTKRNWEHHPKILEIRRLYNEIQSKLKKNEFKYQQKEFSKLPRSCRGTYPLEYIAVATDKGERVRLYTVAQRIAHDDLLTTENFYDESGRLRFVYMSNKSDELALIENRVYLDEQGKVFWDVKSEAKKLTFGEITLDPWMIRNATNEGVFEKFIRIEVKCENEQ